MKANELMIGDWVWYDNQPYQIRRLGIFGENRDGESFPAVCVGKPIGIGLIVEINEVEPISLTPEILKKNGFECRDDLVKSFGDPETFIWENDECDLAMVEWLDSYNDGESRWGEYWLMDINGVNGKISIRNNILYVHELQHALRLCGIEKEIEL